MKEEKKEVGDRGIKGKVYVVGLGPGNLKEMTIRAMEAIQDSDVIVGYNVYIKLIKKLLKGKEVLSSGMKKELERCKTALEFAKKGRRVSLVSSGDAGIYGMAGPLLEMNTKQDNPVEVEIIPGISAANAAAAILGAPLMHDFVVISLSDLLTPWEVILRRLWLAVEGDFVIALYNPRSRGRLQHINRAREILLLRRREDTPVGIVRHAGRVGEEKILTNLQDMLEYEIDMFSVILIGNSHTYIQGGKMVTSRGYSI